MTSSTLRRADLMDSGVQVSVPSPGSGGPSVLYLLNVTNPNRMTADSGWLFVNLLAPELLRRGAALTVAGPVGVSDARARHLPVPAAATKYRARFGFDVAAAAQMLRETRPDVVVANQVEAATGLRTAMLEARHDAVLAGYCHYLPFWFDGAGRLQLDPSLDDAQLGRSVLLTWFAGVLACDRVMVHSRTGLEWISRAADLFGIDLGDRMAVVPAPADPLLTRTVTDAPVSHRSAGLYNHRLYEHYGAELLVDLARALATGGRPVPLRVTDLLGQRPADALRTDHSPERFRGLLADLPNVQVLEDTTDRGTYRRVLASALFAIAPLRPNAIWSMSVIDSLGMGLPLVTPAWGWLGEVADPQLTFRTVEEAVVIVRRLVEDPAFTAAAAERSVAATMGLDPASVAHRYLQAVTR